MVDPPSGWMYNFPARWDDEIESYEEMLRRKNYPEKDIPFAMQYTRQWKVADEDLQQMQDRET